MKHALLTLILGLLLTTSVFAGHNEPIPSATRLISGKIIDKQTGEALAGVKIQVKETDTFCYTDMNGNYFLSVNAKTETELSVDMVGYTPITVKTSETGLEKELSLVPR